jgi:hypothetical protein
MKDQSENRYDRNVDWEPTLADFEKLLLCHIIYRSRLSKEACTESNATIGMILKKSADRVSEVLSILESKDWIKRKIYQDDSGNTHRIIKISSKTLDMISREFKDWYILRVGDYAYPSMTEKHLKSLVSEKDLISIKEKSRLTGIQFILNESSKKYPIQSRPP